MILFDVTSMQPQKTAFKHGGGTYASFVLKRMLQKKVQFAVYFNSKNYLDPEISNLLKEEHIKMYDISTTSFDDIIGSIKNPVVFSILPKPYMFTVKTVGNIHDCREIELYNDLWELYYPITFKRIFVKLYQFLFPSFYLKRQKEKLNRILGNKNFIPVTDTFYSKYKLVSFFPQLKLMDMKVFSSPFDFDDKPVISENKEKIFLLISGNRWLKNNLRVIIALDELFSTGELLDYRVVVTGVPSLSFFKKKIRNTERFTTFDYIDDNKLQDLYRIAYCFIFPSLNEGFGIPPLEAMKYGTPVIATNLTAVPEVCGDAVVYINPHSIDDIKSKILMMAHEQKHYMEMQNKSILHYSYMVKKTLEDTDKYIDYVSSVSEYY